MPESISRTICVLILLKLAYSLLKSGEFTVAEVSEKSGFSDYNYFSRIFKRRYGISPYKIFKTE
ncbi:MAG: helix-turn-helix transcriptional regulator [Clostridiales bacterium]|nr:helix-turn-helix transcriptional regulator [Clostridiales bacterium]